MNKEIKLRAMEPEDLELLYSIENDHSLWEVGLTNVPYSRYVLRDFIANSKCDIYTDRQVRLIIDNGVGETVGMADIINFDPKNRRAEVGIVMIARHRRHGYASMALQQLNNFARHSLHLHQLYAVIDVSNDASIQLFRKAGYFESLQLKDWLYDGEKYHNALLMQIIL